MSRRANRAAPVALLVALTLGASSAHAQTLFEAARAAEAARMDAATQALPHLGVYTNDGPLGRMVHVPIAVPTVSTASTRPRPSSAPVPQAYALRVSNVEQDHGPATQSADDRFHITTTVTAPLRQFLIPKSADELAAMRRTEATGFSATMKPLANVLPRQRDMLPIRVGGGHLFGVDWAADLNGSGRVHGLMTTASLFATAGPQGLLLRSGRVVVQDSRERWQAEAGDMYSDLSGLVRGSRLGVGRGRWTPSVSIYNLHPTTRTSDVVSAYRDKLRVSQALTLSTEIASNGWMFGSTTIRAGGADVTVFARRRGDGRHDEGASASYTLQGVTVSGSTLQTLGPEGRSQWQLASVRVPGWRRSAATLERVWSTTSGNDHTRNALGLQVPFGPLRLMNRFQWGTTSYLNASAPVTFDRRLFQSAASLRLGRYGNVALQQSTNWLPTGDPVLWDELTTSFALGRRTRLQTSSSFPDVSNAQRLRLLLTQQLGSKWSVDLQYGRLSPFQSTFSFDADQRRALLMVRRLFTVSTPAYGTLILGRVVDQAGRGVAGAVVLCGQYRVTTDEAGYYRIPKVAAGTYTVSLLRDRLPASYTWADAPHDVGVPHGGRTQVDFRVIPLSTVSGHVYLDVNRNGRFDASEGVAGIAVRVNGFAVQTEADGSWAVYNQAPGPAAIVLDQSTLGRDREAAGPTRIDRDVPTDRPLADIDFVVKVKPREMQMQDLRKNQQNYRLQQQQQQQHQQQQHQQDHQ